MKKSMIIFSIFMLSISLLFSAEWNMISKIVATDRNNDEYFGNEVAISGNFAIVGAYRENQSIDEGEIIHNAGAAYIFRFDGSEWVQMQKLVASNRGENYYFGCSVDICGDYAIVGAREENVAGGHKEGAAYIFYYDGTSWVQDDRIYADDRHYGDYFGYSVAMTENRSVIGAIYQDYAEASSDSLAQAGAAYVFSRSGIGWSQSAKLVAKYRSEGDNFGTCLAISGANIVVGVPLEDMNEDSLDYKMNAGAAYVFNYDGSHWSRSKKLLASDRNSHDQFGCSVDIDGATIIAGAYMEGHDVDGLNKKDKTGSAYIFDYSGSVWTQTQKIVASERWVSDFFGYDVAIEDNLLIVGAYGEDHDTLAENYIKNAGASYVFKNWGGIWSEQEKITAYVRSEEDRFGNSVDISNDVLIIGAVGEDHDANDANTKYGSGSAYIYSTGVGGVLEANIAVHANSLEILNGDTTPSLIDNTDFGTVYLDSGSVTKAYSISNTGTGHLLIDTIYVQNSLGVNFIISTPPTDSLAPGASGIFSISFTPSDTSLCTGTVNIKSNDPHKGLFLFAVQAKGMQAEVSIDNLFIPEIFSLFPAYPNPFNPKTVIRMQCAENSSVELNIYNIQGVLIEQLFEGYVEPGSYKLIWDARSMPSGIYIVRMTAGNFIGSQKLALIK